MKAKSKTNQPDARCGPQCVCLELAATTMTLEEHSGALIALLAGSASRTGLEISS